MWRGKPGYFSVNCRFSTSTQDQFAIKDLGVACAQKNRMLFVHCTSLLLSQQQFPIEWSWRFTWRRNPHLDPITKTCANAGSAISILHKGHKLLNVVTQELETSFSSFPTILVCVIHHFILLRLQKEFDYKTARGPGRVHLKVIIFPPKFLRSCSGRASQWNLSWERSKQANVDCLWQQWQQQQWNNAKLPTQLFPKSLIPVPCGQFARDTGCSRVPWMGMVMDE